MRLGLVLDRRTPGEALERVLLRHRTARPTDAGDGLKRYRGVIDAMSYDMGATAALFLAGTPQSVADRVAATFRLLDAVTHPTVRGPMPDRFMALLDRSEDCCVCGRSLKDEVSKLLGVGPTCAAQLHLPHNLKVANERLQLRKQLLGEHA